MYQLAIFKLFYSFSNFKKARTVPLDQNAHSNGMQQSLSLHAIFVPFALVLFVSRSILFLHGFYSAKMANARKETKMNQHTLKKIETRINYFESAWPTHLGTHAVTMSDIRTLSPRRLHGIWCTIIVGILADVDVVVWHNGSKALSAVSFQAWSLWLSIHSMGVKTWSTSFLQIDILE